MANKKSFTGFALYSESNGIYKEVFESINDLMEHWSYFTLNINRDKFIKYMKDMGISIVKVEVKIIER